MTREEALQKAREMFGPRGGVSGHMQMKDTLEPAVGVGFLEGTELRIQGKGVTWEAAFACAEDRREKWKDQVPDAPEVVNVKFQPTVPAEFIRTQISLEEKRLTELKRFEERVRRKTAEKWGKGQK